MSAEYRTILKCKRDLTTLLSHDLPSIADELVADGLISPSAGKRINTLGPDNESKASDLMDNVADQIQLMPERFEEFLTILRSAPHHKGLVALLEKTLKGSLESSMHGHNNAVVMFIQVLQCYRFVVCCVM